MAQKAKLSFNSFCRPAGWDNEKKIAILHENFTTVKPEDAYEDFIVKPPVRKVGKVELFPPPFPDKLVINSQSGKQYNVEEL